MLITNKDKEVSHLKIQKDIINQADHTTEGCSFQLPITEKKREVRSPLPTQSKFLVFGKFHLF